MKTLVAFYSRTGTTKKVAELIANRLGADIEEINDTKDRAGPIGYLMAGRDGMKKKLTEITKPKKDASKYDLLICGTPIWGWALTPAVRTYLSQQKGSLKKTAFFCTMGGSGDKNAFLEMEEITGKKPAATLSLITKEVVKGEHLNKIDDFVTKIMK